MRVTLLRHAATAGNEQRRYVGRRTDEPLSARGIEQCARFGERLDVDKVYTSPMLRARQTAELCFPQARVVPVAGLEEFDFGDFEGRSAHEMEHDAAYRTWVGSNCEGVCPGGESLDEFVFRTKQAFAGLLDGARSQGEDQVVAVVHGGTIMAVLDGFYDKYVGNCEGYVVDASWQASSAGADAYPVFTILHRIGAA